MPTELRKIVWSLIVPNTLKITPKLYKILLERVRLCLDNIEKDSAFKKNQKVIDEDLHRTYADLKVFRFGNKLYQPLKNVLLAYSIFRPDLGYVQGMSYVAASIMLHYGNEFQTFMLFANMLNREQQLFNFYSFDMDKVNTVYNVFMRLMKEKLPKMHENFRQTGLSCSIFLFEWIVAVYSNIFQLNMSSRIWDNFFFYGEFYILKTGLAIFAALESKTNSDSFESIVLLIK